MIQDIGKKAVVLGEYLKSFFKAFPMMLFRHSAYQVFRHDEPSVDDLVCFFGGTYYPVNVSTEPVA